ncbi:MAG TPA: hypothetical protein VFA86_09020 [Gammaproteobacteria bacterium]|nr:hypothetical protein [Gammaproteobacteria bacterium]
MRKKTLAIIAMVCFAAGFFWLVIHLELANWDEPLPGQHTSGPSRTARQPARVLPRGAGQGGSPRSAAR